MSQKYISVSLKVEAFRKTGVFMPEKQKKSNTPDLLQDYDIPDNRHNF